IALGSPGPNGEGWANVKLLPEMTATRIELVDPPGTKVRALADDEALYLRFDCEVRDPRTLVEGAQGGDRVWVDIHPLNDPVERWRFQTDCRGDRKAERFQRITGERSLQVIPDIWEKSGTLNLAINQVPLHHGLQAGGWYAEFTIPWRILGLAKRPPVIGF